MILLQDYNKQEHCLVNFKLRAGYDYEDGVERSDWLDLDIVDEEGCHIDTLLTVTPDGIIRRGGLSAFKTESDGVIIDITDTVEKGR